MTISIKDYKKIEEIQNKIINNNANSKELIQFLELIEKSGNKTEISNYIKNIGFDSKDKFKQHLNNKINNQNFIKGLAVLGGAVLLA